MQVCKTSGWTSFGNVQPEVFLYSGEKNSSIFDTSTPAFNNDAAQGNSGPPAPPRDGLAQSGDFYEAFDFSQNPNYTPNLPSVLFFFQNEVLCEKLMRIDVLIYNANTRSRKNQCMVLVCPFLAVCDECCHLKTVMVPAEAGNQVTQA
jgi:hypothetical protein